MNKNVKGSSKWGHKVSCGSSPCCSGFLAFFGIIFD